MRLIDADALRDDWLEHGENEYVYDTNAMLDSIDAQPTIDAVPAVHGRWVKLENTDLLYFNYRCSNCMRRAKHNVWHYCPNCGTMMDGW